MRLVAALLVGLPVRTMAQTVLATVVDRESGAPLAGVMVSLRDSADRPVDLGLTDRRGRLRLGARDVGRYVLGVQRIGAPLERSPAFALDSALILSYEHRVGPVTPIDTARSSARVTSRLRLVPRLDGTAARPVLVVVRTADGEPIADAQITVRDDSGAVRQLARSGTDGRTRLDAPPSARGLLSVRRLGWQPVGRDLSDGALATADTLDVTLAPASVPLAPVTIRAGHPLQRFYGMNPRGISGRVLWPDEIERLPLDAQLVDMLRGAGMPSLMALPVGQAGQYCFAMRYGRDRPACLPIYLDGVRISPDVLIDRSWVHSIAILRPIDATLLFGLDGGGGAILVFTTAVWGERVPRAP